MFDSLRQLLGTLAGIAHTRIELLGTEVEEQVARLTWMLLWTIISLFLAFTTMVLWPNARAASSAVFASAFALGSLGFARKPMTEELGAKS